MTRAEPRKHWRSRLAAAAIALAWGTAAQGAGPLDLYYERSLMLAADARCNLFEPPLQAALRSAQAQARGAALRAGADVAAVTRSLGRAKARAGAAACASSDLATAAGRVRKAFAGYSRLQRMTFPGDTAGWEAHRVVSPNAMAWRLSQAASMGRDRVMFGLGGQGPAEGLIATAVFADGAWPYAARLVLRDPQRAPLPSARRLAARSPLSGRLPARVRARIVMAQGRSLAEPAILPGRAKSGVLFRFPAAATGQIEALDPREAMALEFVFAGPGGDTVRTAYFEVGDFAAGRAFLATGR